MLFVTSLWPASKRWFGVPSDDIVFLIFHLIDVPFLFFIIIFRIILTPNAVLLFHDVADREYYWRYEDE